MEGCPLVVVTAVRRRGVEDELYEGFVAVTDCPVEGADAVSGVKGVFVEEGGDEDGKAAGGED